MKSHRLNKPIYAIWHRYLENSENRFWKNDKKVVSWHYPKFDQKYASNSVSWILRSDKKFIKWPFGFFENLVFGDSDFIDTCPLSVSL